MANELQGLRVAILAADGVEQIELTESRQAVEEAGAEAELLSLESGEIQAMNHDIEPADRFPVRDFFATGKPVGAICHGPWTLIDAGVARGRRLTAWPSVRTDLRNAGAEVVAPPTPRAVLVCDESRFSFAG